MIRDSRRACRQLMGRGGLRACCVLALAVASLRGAPVVADSLKVVINELHYHPADDSREGEFIEIHNHDSQEAADVSGWFLLGGIQYVFPRGSVVPPNGFLLIARDRNILIGRYGLEPSLVSGEYAGSLSNGGELLRLFSTDDYVVSFVEYGDSDPWPETPDGLGPSLERVSPYLEETDPSAWAASTLVGGTPGRRNSVHREMVGPPASDSDIIPQGAIWRFRRGLSEPPPGWNRSGFDDGAWNGGPAGFGYDDGDDATILGDMQGNYTTVYIRRQFSIPDPERVESLSFGISFDDGYVAYLNGVEIARENAPGARGDPVPFDAEATATIGPAPVREVDISSFRNLLIPQGNVLAVQGLNGFIASADFSLHPWLSGRIDRTGEEVRILAPEGADWRFFRGSAAPPADWIAGGFVDAGWESGAAGFGFGDGDDATILDDMQGNYLTVFIRRTFEVEDPSRVVELILEVDYDDGFIAYINGNEVARANVSDGNFDDPALGSHEAGSPEAFPIDLADAALVQGTNVLAVQGHNRAIDNADFSLAPSLRGMLREPVSDPPDPGDLSPAGRDLVINELFPGGPGTGFVELYNPTGDAVDASGRSFQLFPASRGSRTLPPGSIVPPGRYLVITEAELGFELDGLGASILATEDGRFIDALNPWDTAEARSTGRCPDGADNRVVIETPSPGAENQLVPETSVVINEIMYHPADDNPAGEYIELHNRSESPVALGGWAFTRGVSYAFDAQTILGPGGFLVVARNPEAVRAYYGIDPVVGPYDGRLRNDAETLLLRDHLKNVADRVRFADEGSWPESPDGGGPSLELIHPDLTNRYGPTWAASDGDGTPGAPNSRLDPDPEPIVAGVEHSPAVPTSDDAVRVLATISDDEGITSAILFYQEDGDRIPEQTLMVDDGLGDDGVAGNGVYGGDIPRRPDRRIVAFWIQAEAAGGQEATYPDGFPDRTYLYQVEDDPPADLRPLYRVVMTEDNLDTLRTRNRGSNVLLDVTFVADGRAYYNRGIRLRGSSARGCNPLSYRIQFDHDIDFHGIKRLNLNGCSAHRQWIGLDFLRRTGIPTPNAWFRRLSFNGEIQPGFRLRVEAIDGQFLERTIPGDDDGNLYRGISRAELDYRGEEFDPYRPHYRKITQEELDDYSDVVDISFRFDSSTTSDDDFPAAVEERVDIFQWAHYFAAFAVLGSTENSILLNNGDDYFLYHRFSDDRWILLPWDLDSVFNEADQTLFRPTVDAIERFLEHPRHAPDYWCSLESLLESAFLFEQVQTRIDHLAPLFEENLIRDLRGYVGARRDFIHERIQRELTVDIDEGGSFCNDVLVPSRNRISLGGLAPGCGTTAVLVNDEPADYDPQSNQWDAAVDIDGATKLRVVALYRDGFEVARAEFDIFSEGAGLTPLPATIAGSLTLTAAESPYHAPSDVAVEPGAHLTIEPGVTVIMGAAATLRVSGSLSIQGSAGSPVRFLSGACDQSWEGIAFLAGSTGNELRHCEIRHLSTAEGYSAGVAVDGAEVGLENVLIEDGAASLLLVSAGGSAGVKNSILLRGTTGVSVDGGEVSVEDTEIREMSGAGLSAAGSFAGSLSVVRSEIADCGAGIVSTTAGATVLSSRIHDIRGPAVSVRGVPAVLERSLIWNADTAVALSDGATATALHVTIHGCGGGLSLSEETPGSGGPTAEVEGAIIWQTAQPVSVDPLSNLEISFSDTEGGVWEGEGNISADPLFRDASTADFRIAARSPCRGAGRDGADMGALPYEIVGEARRFQRCDANGDGWNDLSDPIHTLLGLFAGGAAAPCGIAPDCNGDRAVDVSDPIFGLNFLFGNGPPPPGPYPGCETAEEAECALETCAR